MGSTGLKSCQAYLAEEAEAFIAIEGFFCKPNSKLFLNTWAYPRLFLPALTRQQRQSGRTRCTNPCCMQPLV